MSDRGCLQRRSEMNKILTAYFSRKGQNYWKGEIRDLEKGNTEIVAEYIREAVGGDLFEIRTVKEYAKEYRACCAEAHRELQGGVRPALKECPADLDGYDIIFVGYPNWCGTMPMAVAAFLEKYDLGGKKIIPFCTNEGSGMGRSEEDLKRICVDAQVLKGLSVRGSEAAASRDAVVRWAQEAVKICKR